MNCKDCKMFIEKYLDGVLENSELTLLKKHIDGCPECRKDFERLATIECTVKEAFASVTSPAQARNEIMAKLSSVESPATLGIKRKAGKSFPKWIPAAASAMLIIGILCGFVLAHIMGAKRHQVPIEIMTLEGSVLVRHCDSQVWEALHPSSSIYLGDVFQTSHKSAVTLMLKDRSKIFLEENSRLSLELYDGGVEFRIEHGTVKADLKSPHPTFVISTPQGHIQALGTEFIVRVK